MTTAMTWASQCPARAVSVDHSQAQLSRLTDRTRLRRLKETLLSKGAWQQVTRVEDLCHAQVSHKCLYHLDVCAGSVLTPHDDITDVQKKYSASSSGRVTGSVSAAALSQTHSWNMQKPAAPLKPCGGTTRDIFTSAAVLGRSAALDVCVASPIAAAARGGAAQAAFDRKLSHHRNEIGELRQQGIHCRPLNLDSGRTTAPSRHSSASVCGRHCVQPFRAASVGEITSSQMEARSPNRSPGGWHVQFCSSARAEAFRWCH